LIVTISFGLFYYFSNQDNGDGILNTIKTDPDIKYYYEHNENVSIINSTKLSKDDFIKLQSQNDSFGQWYRKSAVDEYERIIITSPTDNKDFIILVSPKNQTVVNILAIIKISQ